MDVIRIADLVIDPGPEASDGGGSLAYAGPPSGFSKEKKSYTGKYL
jgi:excinuclease ABC subunit A